MFTVSHYHDSLLSQRISAITKKLPNCIKPLQFDGNNCRYTGNITSNKKYDEVCFSFLTFNKFVGFHKYNVLLLIRLKIRTYQDFSLYCSISEDFNLSFPF